MDLIDREKLLKKLKISADHHEDNSRDYVLMLRDRNIVREQPTVDAQPVIHGEWLGTEYDGYSDGFPVYTTWKCSNCGAEFECEDMDFYYCPNCGAKMDKEQNNDKDNN